MRRLDAGKMLLAGALAVSAGCGGRGGGEMSRDVRMFDLVELLPKATVTAPKPDFVKPLKLVVGSERRDAIFMHPTSRVQFPPFHVEKGSWLEAGLGINELAWDKEGDGVAFNIYARKGDQPQRKIFTRDVNPIGNPLDRHWIDVEVSLDALAGEDVSLVLETTPGSAADAQHDWAGWSRVRAFVPVE